MSKYQVIDLFAGPGGLGEGFSSFVDKQGNKPFKLALSAEKEKAACSTLRLRSFLRQFEEGYPDEYYDFLANRIKLSRLLENYPSEWAIAEKETLELELGIPEHDEFLEEQLDKLTKSEAEKILIGGPPCQAYSLVGRARNRGITDYVAENDHRHFLYREYIKILSRVRPAVFVMENVKGILSSSVGGQRVFEKILEDLKSAGGEDDGYQIIPTVASDGNLFEDEISPSRLLVRSELFGVPQSRHRVIVVGIRKDVAKPVSAGLLKPGTLPALTVGEAIGSFPPLRSGLSKENDTWSNWKEILDLNLVELEQLIPGANLPDQFWRILNKVKNSASDMEPLDRSSADNFGLQQDTNTPAIQWMQDKKLPHPIQHETRGHKRSDLLRYLFSAVFTRAHPEQSSPKAADYPVRLAPDHKNWTSGKFADRFRVQASKRPSTTITSHISKDGHYYIHPDPLQCRSLTVREAARLQTFPDNYLFLGNRTQQYVQVGNAVPPFLALQIASAIHDIIGK